MRNAFEVPNPGELVLTGRVPDGHDILFSLSLGDDPEPWDFGETVLFTATISSPGGVEKASLAKVLTAEHHAAGWLPVRMPVEATGGDQVEISFRFKPDDGPGATGSCLVSVPAIAPRERRAGKPNVIVYLVDALRADHLGCYGYGRATSPMIDAFSQEAVVFEKAYSTSSWTLPALSSIFTGLEPDVHQVIHFSSMLEDKFTTLAELLQENGWTTWQIVAHPFAFMPESNLTQGFDGGAYLDWGRPAAVATAADLNESIFPWIEAHKTEPFFLYVHTNDVHSPYKPPGEYATMFDPDYSGPITGDIPYFGDGWSNLPDRDIEHVKSLYDGLIRFTDTEFGKVLTKLEELGLYDNTMVVFLADHGEAMWDHPGDADIALGWDHGKTLYDEVLRIPLIVKYPDGRFAGTRIASPVSQIDLFPSIADALGLTAPGDLPGTAFADLENDESGTKLFHHLENYVSTDKAGFLHRIYAVRDGGYKYILRVSPRVEQMLFDLGSDPREEVNLAEENPWLAARFRTEIEDRYLRRGFYLRFVSPTHQRLSVRGMITTDGEFRDVMPMTLEHEDAVTVSANRQRIKFALAEEYWEDTVFFRVEPDDARLFLDSTVTGVRGPKRLRLGSWELKAGSLLFGLPANAREFTGFNVRIPSLLYALEPELYLYRLGGETEPPRREGYESGARDIVPREEVERKMQQFRAMGYI